MKTFLSNEHRAQFPKGELSGGQLVRPFECPERWEYIASALQERGHDDRRAPDALDTVNLSRIHSRPYLAFLEVAWADWVASGAEGEAIPTVFPVRGMQQRVPTDIEGRLGFYALAAETAITAGTWSAARASAAIAQSAARDVARRIGEAKRSATDAPAAFALCRPPGHHAASDLFGGYCFLNNAALAAQVLLDEGLERVAVLDVDFHHGNGTQSIFESRSDVFFASLHGEPQEAFPHFLGYADERGIDAGEGFTLNLPMPRGTAWDHWSIALDEACERIVACDPGALVVSLGVDAYEHDPISFFKLTSDDFTRCGERLGRLNLPTVFVMEGGYAVEAIGTNVVNVLEGFESTVGSG